MSKCNVSLAWIAGDARCFIRCDGEGFVLYPDIRPSTSEEIQHSGNEKYSVTAYACDAMVGL